MKVLILDTSTEYLYVRFYDEDTNQNLFEKDMISHNNHSENLLSTIEEGLNQCQMKLKDFGKIVIGYGPGSYTGLRIGMVVGKMASFSLNIPLYVISSLSFVGSGYMQQKGAYAISIIAKKGYSYSKVVKVENDTVKVISDDSFITNEEFEDLAAVNKAYVINENNYDLNEKFICDNAALVENLHDLVPNYLRKANS